MSASGGNSYAVGIRNGCNTIPASFGYGSRCRCLPIDRGRCIGGPDWSSSAASDRAYKPAGIPWYTDGIAGEADIGATRGGLPGESDISAGDYTALRSPKSSKSLDIMLSVIKSNRSIIASMKSAVAGGWDA